MSKLGNMVRDFYKNGYGEKDTSIQVITSEDEMLEPVSHEDEMRDVTIFTKIIKFIKVSRDTNELKGVERILYTYDLRPVEAARRKWDWFNFVYFWMSESFNIGVWQVAGTAVEAGLSWWETWISVWLGYSIVAFYLSLQQRVGSYYHIGFPVSCRASFGIFGSLWPVLNRTVMACLWYGVEAWRGGQCVQIMLKAVFGADLDTRIKDTMSSPNVSTFTFVAFFIFWIFSLPFIWFPPHQIRHLFTFKAMVCPIASVLFLIWAIIRSGGIGPVVYQKNYLHGSEHAWVFIKGTLAAMGNLGTLIVNSPDFSRMAKNRNSALWSQIFAIPLCFSITSLIGILVSSASTILYHKTFWSPLDVLDKFCDTNDKAAKVGAFFISSSFMIGQLGVNICANSLSAGSDMTALFPYFINIRRGGYVCAAIGIAICPWNLMSSSNNFTTYMSSYSVFLSAIAGTISADYFFARRGYLNIWNLYSYKKGEDYHYNFGINWRAAVSYVCGVAINFVGFLGSCGVKVPIAATHVYYLNFIVGYSVSFVVYCVLAIFFPLPGVPAFEMKSRTWLEQYLDVDDFELEFLSGKRSAKLE